MSAQPDPQEEPTLTEPLRLALWRERHNAKDKEGMTGIAERFATEARRRGGSFDLPKAVRVINAVTATRYTLHVLPRWVAESLAIALHLDPSVLQPEGCAPTPLRLVPSSGTHSASHGAARTGAGEDRPGPAAGPASPSPRPGQGNAAAGGAGSTPPPTDPPPATPDYQPQLASACRACERKAARQRAAKAAQAAAAPEVKKYPCRKPGCDGGSDKNEWGRSQHELRAHGQLYGDKGSPPPGMLHHRGVPRAKLTAAPGAYACPICPDTIYIQAADLIRHLHGDHTIVERFDSFPLELIVAETAAHYGVAVGSILSASRVKATVRARQVAMYVTRALTDRTLAEVGAAFKRDHSTALHAEQRITYMVDTDEVFAVGVEILLARIRETYDRARRLRDLAPGVHGAGATTTAGGQEGTDHGEAVVCAPAEPPAPTGPPTIADEPEWEMPPDA